jgi:SAM-dependent methyltransferase
MPSVASRIWVLLKKIRSPLALWRLAVYGVSETWYERRLGIHTLGYRTREELGIENKASGYYAPTAYLDFRKAMRLVDVRPGEDVFLDFGSGMGRVVVMAAMLPFRRVIGVELSAELNGVAVRNLEEVRRRLQCNDVELITADATAFEVPADVTVIYLYNPFRKELLRRVFENIHASLRASPRRVSIVYKNPVYFESDVGDLPWLEKVSEFVCLTGHTCAIYESRPGGKPSAGSA